MPYPTLITHVAADRRCAARLHMTLGVARALGSRIVGVGAQPPWPYANAEEGEGRAFEALVRQAESDIGEAKIMFDDALRGSGVASEWRSEVGYPDMVLPRHAQVADMVVAYRTAEDVDRLTYAAADTLVMEAGLPVLLLPGRDIEFKSDTILLAWKNSREARRAITTTLPLLTAAKRVLIAAVCKAPEVGDIEAEVADVAERLTRHGAKVATLVEVGAPGATARKLSRIAEVDHSDLIVAGGYGHSRLREWMLGGVTRDFIADDGRYVLLSH